MFRKIEKSYNEECQENEFLCITAIFSEETRDLRKKRISKWVPLEIEITVFPEESIRKENQHSTQVNLYVKCSEKYPDMPPYIDIRNPKGISKENLNLLKSELIAKAKALVGQEVILELVNHSRSFLYEHKKPQFNSFFDEMVCNKLKKEQEEAERAQKAELQLKMMEFQKLASIEQERTRKIEALKDAQKKARFADDICSTNTDYRTRKNSSSRQRSRSTSVGKESCSDENDLQGECKEILNSKLKFIGKKEFIVTCGRCLGHNDRGCVTYNALDSVTGALVVVIKWTLHFSVNHKLKGDEWEALQKEQSNYLKQLASIEQEFKTLRQVNHKNLVHYLGMSYFSKKDKITVYILQEYVSGCTMSRVCNEVHFTIPQLQHYSREMLEALQHLHDNSVVHKNLRASSVFIDNNGHVRISDYSLDKRLCDLVRTLTKEEEIDIYPPTIGKGGKKSDLYRLGVLLLSLIIDLPVKSSPVNIPDYLNPTFKDFLNKCLLHDEQERWSAEQLLSHPFLAYLPSINMLPREIEIPDEENNEDSLNLLNNESIQGSRLQNEFDILKILGKGGFGHVWKVKNKLDSRIYALKKIPLNPSNKQLNRKIKREVKLLSRLNHENIVRYYNSWIEASPENPEDSGSEVQSDQIAAENAEKTGSSIKWDFHNKDFSSSEDDDDDDNFIIFMSDDSPENNQRNQIKIVDVEESSTPNQSTVGFKNKHQHDKIKQFMYIQMQFCEKSTLRTAIDNGLHKDVSLVWRLFREIVEGLHYIHQQGVIHRDLKPVNIFLDSNDHVKIGDFGLATDVFSKSTTSEVIPFSDQDQSRSDMGDGVQTGRVGTAFYVAPELSMSSKISYSQKVDIYSLGIIFFEMCYPPPITLMERNIIISNLRLKEMVLPENAINLLTDEMVHIIKWLLIHDITKRPSSNELITSKYIPPLLMEESELNSLLNSTISNPQSRMYKHMISALFDQEVATEFDFTYDIDVFKNQSSKIKPSQIFIQVVDTLNKFMKLHAAVYYSIPTLSPKCSVIKNENCVQIMEHGGGIVTLPHNLRVPFARHVARREIDYLKRYSLEKVYRQQKVFGCHPREQYEFAFDIITPTPNSFLPDAEIISCISEIISEFPTLDSRNYYLRLNHASLLKAIFIYAEIDDNLEEYIIQIAGEHKYKTVTKALLIDEHNNLDLTQRSITRLSQFVELEENIEKIGSFLHPIMQKKGRACTLAKNSLKELENIVLLTQALGVKLPIVICPGLIHNISLFSGMFFQCISKLKTSKKKNLYDVLAAGGRYDKLIQSFKLKAVIENEKYLNQSAVGMSIAIESIIAAELESTESQELGMSDFLIHSEGAGMSAKKALMMKQLHEHGMRATILCDNNMTLDDAADFCRGQGIQHLLLLRKEDPGIIKIRTLDGDRILEKRIIYSEIMDHLPKLCFKSFQSSKTEYSRNTSVTNSSISVNVHFLPPDKNHSVKKREPNIRTHVISTLQGISSRVWELIPIDLKMQIIGRIIALCDISATTDAIQRSFDAIIDEFGKFKKYLSQLCEEICDIRSKQPSCTIILYSLPDNNFRVLL